MNIKINSEPNEVQHQTVSFADQNSQWTYSVDNQLDSIHKSVDSNDADLNNFFSRPIKIASINWPVGSVFGTTINPWTEYFSNLRVVNRISNYNVLRAKLCVRMMINGNGFHYGRALASYRPLHNDDDFPIWRYGLVPQDIIGASQRMHAYLDPTKSQGATLCLPYIYYTNGLNIPEQEWTEMGELDIASITTLEHANQGTDAVTISVFAWAEDVSLSMPTRAEPGALAPQSCLEEHADEADKASQGPISGPANAVAQAAGALRSVPGIGTYATAAQTAAGAISTVARAFGLSRPVDTGPIHSYKPTYMGNLANTNVLDTSTKLTYDVRQGVTIDPSAVGLGPTDEMTIASIAQRESYLTQFVWPTSAVPETLLWNSFVMPSLQDQFATTVTEYHMTPMSYAAMPFNHWRGSIKFRFQIVASAFHKGRLKIVYDPYFSNATSEYNVQQTHVIDLAKERDFTVEVGWAQQDSYLQVRTPLWAPFGTTPFSNGARLNANGLIQVFVVNDLTTPSAVLSSAKVLVSVCAGDDFEVVNPTDNLDEVTYWQPQSLLEDLPTLEEHAGEATSADDDLTTNEAAPISTDTEKTYATDNNTNAANLIYYGDPVTSLRQLFKRYEFYRAHATASSDEQVYFTLPDFPWYRGYGVGVGASPDFAAAPIDPTAYAYTETTMLNWFTPCFLARRGGIRHKFVWTSNSSLVAGIMSVTRYAQSIGYQRFTRPNLDGSSNSTAVYVAANRALEGHNGSVATPVFNNPALEVELPYHSKYRFRPARKKNMGSVSEFNTFHQLSYPTTPIPGGAAVVDYVAAAEDFSLSFFQACPIFYQDSNPVSSASF